MELWHYWVIAGLLLLIVEIFTPAFVLGSFGIGCFIASITAYLQFSIYWQIFVFCVGTLLIFFTIRPLFIKYLLPETKKEKTNVDALAGQRALVLEQINNLHGKGRVKIGGEDWRAISDDGSEIEVNAVVEIIKVDGSKVIVARV